MDNQERAYWKLNIEKSWKVLEKKLESLKEEVIRLISLLEQALRSKFGKAKFTAQPEPLLTNPQNLGANKVSFEYQQAMYSQIA